MPQVSYPGDITVTGQRRSNSSQSFPSSGGGTSGGEPRPPITDTAPDGTPDEQPPDPFNPCDHELTAIPWNADAAGAKASISEFLSKAAELGDVNAQNGKTTLGKREFGRALGRGPGYSVFGNAVSNGTERNPADTNPVSTMDLRYDGISLSQYIGDSHTHPNGNRQPSEED